MPLGEAIGIDAAVAYSLVVVAVLMLPETKGKKFETERVETERVKTEHA
jgi:hypothetical protein